MGTAGMTLVLPSGKRGLRANGKAAVKNAGGECPECSCGGAPGECPCTAEEWVDLIESGTPCHGIVDAYRIAGYAPSLFEACPDCGPSGSAEWNGSMLATGTPWRCLWEAFGWPDISQALNGRVFYRAMLALVSSAWQLTARCRGEFETFDVWIGRKAAGGTPVGTYLRTGGSSASPSALDIEEAP